MEAASRLFTQPRRGSPNVVVTSQMPQPSRAERSSIRLRRQSSFVAAQVDATMVMTQTGVVRSVSASPSMASLRGRMELMKRPILARKRFPWSFFMPPGAISMRIRQGTLRGIRTIRSFMLCSCCGGSTILAVPCQSPPARTRLPDVSTSSLNS